jgi:hypothetical protein
MILIIDVRKDVCDHCFQDRNETKARLGTQIYMNANGAALREFWCLRHLKEVIREYAGRSHEEKEELLIDLLRDLRKGDPT